MMERLLDHWLIVLLVCVEIYGWQQDRLMFVNLILAGLGVLFVVGWVIAQVITYRRQKLPVPRFPDLIKFLWNSRIRAAQIKGRWRMFCIDNGWGRTVTTAQGRGFRPMRLRRLVPTSNGDLIATVSPGLAGINPSKVWEGTDYLASAIGCKEISLKQVGPGSLRIKFTYSEPLARVLPVAQLPLPSKGHLAYGIREDGSTAEVAIDLHLLVGGMTRQGKSSLVWTLLADVLRQGIPLKVWCSDPKGGSEFHVLGNHVGEKLGGIQVRAYATTDKATQEMLAECEKAMTGRQRDLARKGMRKVTKFDDRNPLNVIILDEFLALNGVIKQGVTGGPLGRLLSQGAAAGFLVIGLAQVGHADVLKTVRNMFPQVVCFKVPNTFTQDTFLGGQSATRGAKCYALSSTNHRGVGYSGAETEATFTRYRAAFCSDKPRNGRKELSDLHRIAAGVMPLGMEKTLESLEEQKRACRYVAWGFENEDGGRRLLYIGKSTNPGIRIQQHIDDPREPWWSTEDDPRNEVDPVATYDSIRWFDTEKKALAFEKKLIKQQAPKYNSIHNENNPARKGKDRQKVHLRIVKDTPKEPVVEGEVLTGPREITGRTDFEGEWSEQVWGE